MQCKLTRYRNQTRRVFEMEIDIQDQKVVYVPDPDALCALYI